MSLSLGVGVGSSKFDILLHPVEHGSIHTNEVLGLWHWEDSFRTGLNGEFVLCPPQGSCDIKMKLLQRCLLSLTVAIGTRNHLFKIGAFLPWYITIAEQRVPHALVYIKWIALFTFHVTYEMLKPLTQYSLYFKILMYEFWLCSKKGWSLRTSLSQSPPS